ncbi:MAG: glycogen synthase, partial [Bifidobacteriaceae bacterium]|nr:glycogen synthase [Bifidobacteriaceae bacterium]
MVTREYPPAVYGGAGVHVAELVKVLRKRAHVHVRCFGEPRTEPGVTAYPEGDPAQAGNAALAVFGTDLQIAGAAQHADIVHSHTWYANLAGHLAALLGGVPHVLTAHSLEPLRPWKAEQLGGGYRLSRWAERTAYQAAARVIAVSAGMRRDILRVYPEVDPDKVVVVHNGIDVDAWHPYRGEAADKVLDLYGIDPGRPTVVFVGRQTRQKGLPYLLRAAARLEPEVQIVLCAGAPDTPEIEAEVKELVGRLRAARGSGVVFIDQMLPHLALMAILTAATVFVCPSIYEPLGIVNLEAMACGVPVVGTATGGIPEVVAAGETGWLVPIEQAQDGTGTPVDPARYVTDLCGVLGEALSD